MTDNTSNSQTPRIDHSSQLYIPKVTYGGFWRRLGANLIDGFIFLPFGLLIFFLLARVSIWLIILFQIMNFLIAALYPTILHAHYGATLGKMVTGLTVRKQNLEPIGWVEAIKRSSVDYGLILIIGVGNISTFLSIPQETFMHASTLEANQMLQAYQIPFYSYANTFFMLWFWSEVLVLLFNKKRRAIHDFIAGTLVVVKDSIPL
jgi:uncharacterized RDD family membrane protein YckC